MDVGRRLEDRAQGVGNLAGREGPGGDLVGQRLEEMEVAAVDERDLDRGATQALDGVDPAEAPADDHHAVGHGVDAG